MYSNAGVNGKCQLHFDKTIKWTAHLISMEQKISTFGSYILRVEVVVVVKSLSMKTSLKQIWMDQMPL